MTKAEPELLAPGTLLGARYTITRYLGGGGVGDVYQGEDSAIARKVAIKILNLKRMNVAPHEREHLLMRFEREARAAARIQHPNVITIHDTGVDEESGHPFLVMELLQGHDLRTEMNTNGPLEATRGLPLFIACLDALAEAHRMEIVHKDLKPANLFLTHPGTPRETLHLVDFGVAHILPDERLTQAGQMACTPNYTAPEYINKKEIGAYYDIYQMGLILVELFTASPVVDLASPGLCLAAHAEGRLNIPVALLDSPLGPIIRRALAQEPEQRYPDAEAMKGALEAIDPAAIGAVEPSGLRRFLSAPLPPTRVATRRGLSGEVAGASGSVEDDISIEPITEQAPENTSSTVVISDALQEELVEGARSGDGPTTLRLGGDIDGILSVDQRANREALVFEGESPKGSTLVESQEELMAPVVWPERSALKRSSVKGGPMWLLVTALVGLVLLGLYPCLAATVVALVDGPSAAQVSDGKPGDEGSSEASGDKATRSKEAR